MKFQTFFCVPTFFSQLALAEGNLNIRHGSLLLHKNSAISDFFVHFFRIKSVTLHVETYPACVTCCGTLDRRLLCGVL